MRYLIVVDMQNDFIDGALGSPEAQAIVPAVIEKIKAFDGEIFYTRDTHFHDYLSTREGRALPVEHCIENTNGWKLEKRIDGLRREMDSRVFDKPAFGSAELIDALKKAGDVTGLEVIGLCTDICVISNAVMLRSSFPETPVAVDASCCAGVTVQSHETALAAMKMCQIDVCE